MVEAPYSARDLDHPYNLSNFEAFNMIVKSVFGYWTFIMPMAFYSTGIVIGILALTLLTVLLSCGTYIMINCMLEASRRTSVESMTMSETVEYAFSEVPRCCYPKFFGGFVDGMFGFVHMMLGAWLVKALSVPLASTTILDMGRGHIGVISAGLLLLPAFMLRDLKLIVPFSVLGNLLTIAFFISLIINRLTIKDGVEFPVLFNCQLQSLVFIGLSLLAINSFGVLITIEPSLASPEKYLDRSGLFIIGTLCTWIANIIVGVGGLIMFDKPMYFPLLESLYTPLTNFAITVIIYCSYPLTGFVSVETFYRNVAPDLKINEYFARLIYLVVTVITAVFHPYLFPAVMFSGILGGTVLNLIIPACVQLCLLNSEEDKKLKCLCYLLIVSGIIILCVGLYSVHFGIMMKLTKDAGNNLWIST